MRRYLFIRVFILSTTALASTAPAQRAATFFGLGDLPGGDFNSFAMRVSTNGHAATGFSLSGGGFPGTFEAFRWTQDEGMIPLGKLDGGTESFGYGVSANGRYVVGTGGSTQGGQAFLWSEDVGIQGLGRLQGAIGSSAATGVSADGSVVVGWGGNGEAFRWTQSTGMVGIGFLPGASSSSAAGVTDDGTGIVGSSGGRVFLWIEDSGYERLGNARRVEERDGKFTLTDRHRCRW